MNPFRTVLLPWSSIDRMEMGEYLLIPMAFVVLLDGSRFHIFGIDGTPNIQRATRQIRDLNALVLRERDAIQGQES